MKTNLQAHPTARIETEVERAIRAGCSRQDVCEGASFRRDELHFREAKHQVRYFLLSPRVKRELFRRGDLCFMDDQRLTHAQVPVLHGKTPTRIVNALATRMPPDLLEDSPLAGPQEGESLHSIACSHATDGESYVQERTRHGEDWLRALSWMSALDCVTRARRKDVSNEKEFKERRFTGSSRCS